MRFLLTPIFWIVDFYIAVMVFMYKWWSAFVDWFFQSVYDVIYLTFESIGDLAVNLHRAYKRLPW